VLARRWACPIALESEVEAWLEPPFGTYLRGRCGGCYVRTADGVSADFYGKLQAAGIDVIYDDTDERAGGKFATMDLIGVPYQVIVGPKGVKAGEAELKNRKTGARETLSFDAALAKVVGAVKSERVLV